MSRSMIYNSLLFTLRASQNICKDCTSRYDLPFYLVFGIIHARKYFYQFLQMGPFWCKSATVRKLLSTYFSMLDYEKANRILRRRNKMGTDMTPQS